MTTTITIQVRDEVHDHLAKLAADAHIPLEVWLSVKLSTLFPIADTPIVEHKAGVRNPSHFHRAGASKKLNANGVAFLNNLFAKGYRAQQAADIIGMTVNAVSPRYREWKKLRT